MHVVLELHGDQVRWRAKNQRSMVYVGMSGDVKGSGSGNNDSNGDGTGFNSVGG